MKNIEKELKEILAQSKNKSLGAESFVRDSLIENKYPKEFMIYFLNSENFGGYESEFPAYEAWQHQQAKVEELQKQLNEYIFVAETLDEMYVKEVKSSDELQKRVDAALELMQKPVIVGEPSNYVCARFTELEQALKGEG